MILSNFFFSLLLLTNVIELMSMFIYFSMETSSTATAYIWCPVFLRLHMKHVVAALCVNIDVGIASRLQSIAVCICMSQYCVAIRRQYGVCLIRQMVSDSSRRPDIIFV